MSLGIASDGLFGSGGGGGGIEITSLSPVAGSTIEADDDVVLTAESSGGAANPQSVEIRFIGGGSFLEVYDGVSWLEGYESSEIDVVSGIATITLRADDGWVIGLAEVRVTDDDATMDVAGSWWLEGEVSETGPDPVPIPAEIIEESDVSVVDHWVTANSRVPAQFRGRL